MSRSGSHYADSLASARKRYEDDDADSQNSQSHYSDYDNELAHYESAPIDPPEEHDLSPYTPSESNLAPDDAFIGNDASSQRQAGAESFIGVNQYLAVLRKKSLMPQILTLHESIEAFHEHAV